MPSYKFDPYHYKIHKAKGGTSFLSNITNDILIGATCPYDGTTMTLSLFSIATQQTAMHAPALLTTAY